jgi:hypothetical protein
MPSGFGNSVGDSMKKIGYATRGFIELPPDEQALAILEFDLVSSNKDDWLYSLRDGRVFAQENEQGTYTLMVVEEY